VRFLPDFLTRRQHVVIFYTYLLRYYFGDLTKCYLFYKSPDIRNMSKLPKPIGLGIREIYASRPLQYPHKIEQTKKPYCFPHSRLLEASQTSPHRPSFAGSDSSQKLPTSPRRKQSLVGDVSNIHKLILAILIEFNALKRTAKMTDEFFRIYSDLYVGRAES
jgi:hypothetical protein